MESINDLYSSTNDKLTKIYTEFKSIDLKPLKSELIIPYDILLSKLIDIISNEINSEIITNKAFNNVIAKLKQNSDKITIFNEEYFDRTIINENIDAILKKDTNINIIKKEALKTKINDFKQNMTSTFSMNLLSINSDIKLLQDASKYKQQIELLLSTQINKGLQAEIKEKKIMIKNQLGLNRKLNQLKIHH